MKATLLKQVALFPAISCLVPWAVTCAAIASEPKTLSSIHRQTTPGGSVIGILGDKPSSPQPTLFVFSGGIKDSLEDTNYRPAQRGFLCVSVDLPCFGSEKSSDDIAGLSGWCQRVERGRPFVAEFCHKLSGVLDHLVATSYSDPNYIAAMGVSRGGFVALQWAARDSRVKAVAAFAPVTDLGALHEFRGIQQSPAVSKLRATTLAEQLAGRRIWIVIGDQDQRVGTDSAIDFARRVSAASAAKARLSRLELHVVPEDTPTSNGHTVPAKSYAAAAKWFWQTVSSAGQ
jgi:dienelactone hydrolase